MKSLTSITSSLIITRLNIPLLICLILINMMWSTFVHADQGQINFSGKLVKDTDNQSVQTYIKNHPIDASQLKLFQPIPQNHAIYSHSHELPQQVQSVTPTVVQAKDDQTPHVTYTIQYH